MTDFSFRGICFGFDLVWLELKKSQQHIWPYMRLFSCWDYQFVTSLEHEKINAWWEIWAVTCLQLSHMLQMVACSEFGLNLRSWCMMRNSSNNMPSITENFCIIITITGELSDHVAIKCQGKLVSISLLTRILLSYFHAH